MLPIPEAPIEIADRNRKQVRRAQQKILYVGAAEIREKAQRSTAVRALQIVHLRPRGATAEVQGVAPHRSREARKRSEPVLHAKARKLNAGTDLPQVRQRAAAARKGNLRNHLVAEIRQ